MRAEARDPYQMSLMEINRPETRRRVEAELERARLYKQVGFVRRETKITPTYEPREGGSSHAISKQIENTAIYNVDGEARLKKAHEQVTAAFRALSNVEQQIINQRYLVDDEAVDYNVYSELNLSERSYYRRKNRALYKLAFAMNLEAYVGDVTA